MAESVQTFIRKVGRTGAGGLGALAVAGTLLAFSAGAASADVEDIEPNPAVVSGGPLAEEGVRGADPGFVTAGPSEVRAAAVGAPLAPAGGESKDSIRAVPSITGGIGTYIDMGPFDNGPPIWDW
ncbi:hypothetical protein JRC04_18340 [Mycolicibacterium sp. S2-37]|uniref:hypothetical protein n=1 Tax=Mycolicibacterium sp. S2-37 TaxID=2810297 RepID=UPI001A941192|nr:hypothetical protein [Mycolicibacterium sp. S2-37]MBO0679425.1 hypothetical protein [Mycolicibacterium sp. S2-37]